MTSFVCRQLQRPFRLTDAISLDRSANFACRLALQVCIVYNLDLNLAGTHPKIYIIYRNARGWMSTVKLTASPSQVRQMTWQKSLWTVTKRYVCQGRSVHLSAETKVVSGFCYMFLTNLHTIFHSHVTTSSEQCNACLQFHTAVTLVVYLRLTVCNCMCGLLLQSRLARFASW